MNGFVVEYVQEGWPTLEIQLGVTEAHFDKTKEVLSIWEFQNAEEMTTVIEGLRNLRKPKEEA